MIPTGARCRNHWATLGTDDFCFVNMLKVNHASEEKKIGRKNGNMLTTQAVPQTEEQTELMVVAWNLHRFALFKSNKRVKSWLMNGLTPPPPTPQLPEEHHTLLSIFVYIISTLLGYLQTKCPSPPPYHLDVLYTPLPHPQKKHYLYHQPMTVCAHPAGITTAQGGQGGVPSSCERLEKKKLARV